MKAVYELKLEHDERVRVEKERKALGVMERMTARAARTSEEQITLLRSDSRPGNSKRECARLKKEIVKRDAVAEVKAENTTVAEKSEKLSKAKRRKRAKKAKE